MKHIFTFLFAVLVLAACSGEDDPTGPAQNPYRGDVNLNDIAFEIADVVMFSEYFTKGTAVFTKNLANQTSATDMNDDGVALSIADFVYGVRVVIGDAPPRPLTTPVNVRYAIDAFNRIEILDGIDCGAMRLVIQGRADPTLLDPDMEMKWESDSTYSWILIYSLAGSSFSGDIVAFDGTLISMEVATAEGAPCLPTQLTTQSVYPIDQNYPNPFGPGVGDTAIMFLVPRATEYTVTISDVLGNEVQSIQGYTEAGVCAVYPDFSGYESGVYFYRVEAQGETFTRKLLLVH